MNIIIPTDDDGNMVDLTNVNSGIFLAGPCPRKNYETDDKWRNEAYEILKEIGFDGDVLNPTNKNYLKMKDLTKQTNWENEAMKKASAIVFWLERTDEHPGFTSNYEIGQWMSSPGVYVGIPEDSKKKNANNYIAIKAEQAGKKVYSTLKDLLLDVTYDLEQKGKTWFTSDTHFGAERTLEFSRRPFRNVEDMDLEIISNWNKNVRPNDEVYHLGDFGDYSRLSCLNGKIKIIAGNYERDGKTQVPDDVVLDGDIDDIKIKSKDGFEYTLRHEPVNPLKDAKENKDAFYLFGHIHEKNKFKTNGINVGTDIYHFTPVELEEIDWMRNAVLNHLDENVFVEKCK